MGKSLTDFVQSLTDGSFMEGGNRMDASTPVSDQESVTCPNCGASLAYKPGTTSLVCEHCGSSFEIKIENTTTADAQKENDLSAVLAGNWQAAQSQGQAYAVTCPACGAQTALEQNLFSSQCAFCGTPLTVQPDVRAVANPQAVLPLLKNRQPLSVSTNGCTSCGSPPTT